MSMRHANDPLNLTGNAGGGMQISSRRPVRPLFLFLEGAEVRAFVVAGSPVARRPLQIEPRPGDFVVAADLGAEHALAWGWPVHLLVGDLDSLPAATLDALTSAQVESIRVPAAKDQTDTELALAAALDRHPGEIIVCGGLGGQTDHLLANVLLLAHPSLADVVVSLVDGPETIRLTTGTGDRVTTKIAGNRGDLVSLLPFGSAAEGVETHNLLYPLLGETLYLGEARGISNVMSGERAEVSLTRGSLIVVHIGMGSI
jgi:thiamine pyrophosphokinase